MIFLIHFNLSSVLAQEYLYPVGHIYQETLKILLLYQKSAHHVELWQWDPITKEAGKAILSSFTPAGIAMLPNDLGYSFIDNDTIRIAYTAKRSPKLVPLYEPLYDFTTLQWLDGTRSVLSAKENEQYGIYCIDDEGDCIELMHDTKAHYRYPIVKNNQIYYIQIIDDTSTVMQATLPSLYHVNEQNPQEIYAQLSDRIQCPLNDTKELLSTGTHAIAFLNMFNAREGSYIEYQSHIDRHAQKIKFTYHLFKESDGSWQDAPLFTFAIPAAFLLDPNERLHESILPFLPKREGATIYYFNCIDNSLITTLNSYSLITQSITAGADCGYCLIGTYFLNNKLWYGGVLSESKQDTDTPCAWVDEAGIFRVTIPNLDN